MLSVSLSWYEAPAQTPCTLQLMVNMIHKEKSVKGLLGKARALVRLFPLVIGGN